MVTDGIRAFMNRDWRAARAAKDAYWRDRVTRLGPTEAWRIAEELRQQALCQMPGWPREADRESDWLHHARLAAILQRADPACRG